MAFLHNAQLLYTDCGYPRWSVWLTMPNAIFFYFLFNNFYQQNFKASKGKVTAKTLNDDNNNNDSNNNESKPNKDLDKKQS